MISQYKILFRRTVSIVVSIGLGLAAAMLLMVIFEEKFIYFPSKHPKGNWQPETYGLNAEDCFFSTSGGLKLHGWLFRVGKPKATLLWCHGNAGNITHRLDNISKLLPLGINIFIFDYRGYGKSEGSPSEKGIYNDAIAAYDYLTHEQGVNSSSIIIFGRSLGAIVATHLAANRLCRGLIVESGFSSSRDMAKELFPFLPLHFFLRSKFDAMSMISRIHIPLLFIHGTNDNTVPINLGRKLFERANEPKSFYEILGADHNDTYIVGGDVYFKRLNEFIDQVAMADFDPR
jgi:fermentation-respiration switch protein FrsA (DUF1100 family)